MTYRVFSKDEDDAIERMLAEGVPVPEIARALGRSLNGIQYRIKFGFINRSAYAIQPERMVVSPEILAARDKRLATAPRDLTAMICGDPRPGYSELDRRTNAQSVKAQGR